MDYKTDKSEHAEQVRVIQWSKRQAKFYPELKLLFAIPNGGKGIHTKMTQSKLKLEGVKPGVPDLFLPVARQYRHGLFIEMKREKKSATTSKIQDKVGKLLRQQGYGVFVAHGSKEAIEGIKKYLGIL